MAVYTEVSDTALRDYLALYNIGELVSVKGIAEGVENTNYLLMTDQGRYILTLYEKRVASEDLPFFLGLKEHLSKRGLNCPLPVHQRDGAMIGELAGRPAAIITFLDGAWPKQPEAHHCAELGRSLAQMHVAGEGFALSRKNTLAPADWRPLWEKAAARAAELFPEIAAQVEADLNTLDANWPTDLPQGIIHADLFPDNVFFMSNKLTGMIDFYFACNDALAYDVAICINAWCFSKDGQTFYPENARAIVENYHTIRPLSAEEQTALPILCLGAAMRFALTRLYDWINTPEGSLVVKKDPQDYFNRMVFHREAKDLKAYGLTQL